MLIKINGQFIFYYGCLKNKKTYNLLYLRLVGSLLGILIGIFLLPQIAYFSNITPEKLIELTNKERLDTGLNPLTANQLLTQAAYQKGQAILKEQVFQHNINEKKFSDWIKETGYKYSYVGENLAIDFMTSEGAIEAWLDSESHRNNLLNPYYQEIGIAVLTGQFNGQDTTIITQIFGSPPKNVIQPKILGMNSQNYLTGQKNLPTVTMYTGAENFLTHIISQSINNDSTLISNYSATVSLENNNYNFNKVNKFFIQYNILLNTINLFSVTLLISLLLAMIYIYILYFSYLFKSF